VRGYWISGLAVRGRPGGLHFSKGKALGSIYLFSFKYYSWFTMVILNRNVTATVEVMTVCFLTLVDYFNQDVHLCIDKSKPVVAKYIL